MCHMFRRIISKEVRPIPIGPTLLDVNPEENLDGVWICVGVIKGQALSQWGYNTTTVS